MIKQKTFNKYQEAIEWLQNLAGAFKLQRATITKHQLKKTTIWDDGERYKITATYK